jgi:hypothetical protein
MWKCLWINAPTFVPATCSPAVSVSSGRKTGAVLRVQVTTCHVGFNGLTELKFEESFAPIKNVGVAARLHAFVLAQAD